MVDLPVGLSLRFYKIIRFFYRRKIIMKKSLVKLVAVSATAMSLATVVVPAANAYYKADDGTEYAKLTNVSQATYAELLPEITGKIVAIRGEIATATTAVEEAKAKLAAAEKVAAEKAAAYADAKAEYEAALKSLEAAKVELANAEQELNNLEASYGEYTTKLAALEQARDQKIDEAAQVLSTEQAQAESDAESAIIAQTEAQNAYDVVAQKLADAQAQEDFPADALADLQAQEQQALAALTEARNVAAQAVIDRDNALAAAQSKHDSAVSNANAQYTSDKADLEREYNVSDVYGVDAKIVAAKKRVSKAEAAVNKAETAVKDTKAALDAAKAENDQAQKDLAAAQLEVSKTTTHLSGLYSDKAALEQNLHELVVGSQANSTDPSKINVNKEEQEIIKEITGKTSKELEDEANKWKNKHEEDLAHLEELEGKTKDPQKPGESEDDTDDESDDEGSSNGTDKEDSKDGKKVEKKSDAKLPETGEASTYAIFGAAALSILAGLGLVAPKFSKED